MRFDIKKILDDPELRKELMLDWLVATQAIGGVTTTRKQAEDVYEKLVTDLSKDLEEEKKKNKRFWTVPFSNYYNIEGWLGVFDNELGIIQAYFASKEAAEEYIRYLTGVER